MTYGVGVIMYYKHESGPVSSGIRIAATVPFFCHWSDAYQ